MNDFLEFLKGAKTSYHSVTVAKTQLESAGFRELSMEEPWSLKRPGAYMCAPSDSMLYAFVLGNDYEPGDAMRLAVAHTDYPCLHIKPGAEVKGSTLLDVEVYGGPILNTWLDRPLGIAGRVYVESEGKVEKVLVDSGRGVVTIPNLPIHFNRDVNKGVELKKQIDLRPLAGCGYEEGWFANYVAELCHCKRSQLLDYDLFLYVAEAPEYVGLHEELVSAPRLDNQTSCYALLQGIIEKMKCLSPCGLSIIALYDNEEVGSTTKQGADSALYTMLLEKIYEGLFGQMKHLKEAILKSRMISLDVAHALHPSHPERYDTENTGKLGDGVILKLSSNQRYAYDPQIVAETMLMCRDYGIPYAKHVNHSDQPGGSTMGPVLSSWLPMPTLDAGVPILAMHSARELMHRGDMEALVAFAKAFLVG